MRWWTSHTIALLERVTLRHLLLRRLQNAGDAGDASNAGDAPCPVVDPSGVDLWKRTLSMLTTPLWSRRNTNTILIGLRVDILWHRCVVLVWSRGATAAEQLES